MHVSNLNEFVAFVSELGYEVDSSFDSVSNFTYVSIVGYGISHMISFPVCKLSQDLSPADSYLCYHVGCLLQDISFIRESTLK